MESLEFFTNQYAFLTPLLLPWMQKLCHDSAEEQLKVLFETELATPLQLVSCTNFSYKYVRATIVPRLIQFIEKGGGKSKSSDLYLRSKLAIQFSRQIQEKEAQQMQQQQQKPKQEEKPSPDRKYLVGLLSAESDTISREDLTKISLNARYFELFLTDILNDLCSAFNVTNILCIEKMAIIQYIRSLIYECEKKVKHDKDEINVNSYSGLICCNLLSILNDEYGAECVCDSEDTNLSNFKVFTDIIIENNIKYPQIKNDKENMEIDIEKLQRKLKQQQQQMVNTNRRGPFSQHSSLGIGDAMSKMTKIPHTPQISAVGNPLNALYRQTSPDPNSDWEDDIDLSNAKQIMRGHSLHLINENNETADPQSNARMVSFRVQPPAPPAPPAPIPLNRARSQSYETDKRYHSTQIQARDRTQSAQMHHLPHHKQLLIDELHQQQSITEEEEDDLPQWNTSNSEQNASIQHQSAIMPLRRQQSHPMPMPMSTAASSSVNTPSPNVYYNNAPPPPPIAIQDHKSLPIGGTVMSTNFTGDSVQSVATDHMYNSNRNVNLDTPFEMSKNTKKFSTISPPKPTDFSGKDSLQRGLSKTDFFAKYLIDSKIIGQGSFAVVRRCKRVTDDMILAMKIIKKKNIDKESDMELIRREIQILLQLDHPNVICVYDWCETNSRLFIVLDFCGGGNVLDRIIQKGSFSEFETAQLMRELAITIEYYHAFGIVHRDLKPENIMYLDEAYNQMKLIDFGMANTLKNKKGLELETACGSPLYAAPEILNNEKYGTPVDMWSVGVITYLLLCGFPPFFDTQNIKNVYYQIRQCKYKFPSPFWDNISDGAKDFISHLLVLDVGERYTAANVLNHAWIKNTVIKHNATDIYDALPEYNDEDDFSSTDDDDMDSSNADDIALNEDIDYDQMIAEDAEMDININPLHSPVVSGSMNRGYSLLKRSQTEQVLKKLKSDPGDTHETKSNKKKKKNISMEIELKGKYKDHNRGKSLMYMNQGTIFSAQRDHLQKQKVLILKERDDLTRETAKITKQRQEILQLLDQHNEFKKLMTNFEREKAIFTQEKEKWIAAKGGVDVEKQRLGEIQQTMTVRMDAAFDKFVSETQEQRKQLSDEYLRLNAERIQMKEKNEELSKELQRLHEERTQFEIDRNNSLPEDIQKLRKDLENEWLKIAQDEKEIETEHKMNEEKSTKLIAMMDTLNSKEAEIERDHKELLEIKEKMLELEKEKKREIALMNSEEFEDIQKKTVMQQQRELEILVAGLEAEKQEFKQLKLDFFSENLGNDDDPNVSELDWKRKYLLMKTDFDKYCDEMDAYCDNLEVKCQEAEDKYHHLYATFDAENSQLTEHISKKNETLSVQEERLRELEEAEEMWQHHAKETDQLKKELDEKHKKFDRISDQMNSLHEQIANYKAQLEHYVEVETELDELKKQIEEKGGTAGISIIHEDYDTEYDTEQEEEAQDKSDLQINRNASILRSMSNHPSGASQTEDEAIQSIKVGDRVELQKGWIGRIQYIGSVPPIKHEVIGIALDDAIPDGHDGKGLFVCKAQHGYFTQRWRIKRVIHISTPKSRKTPVTDHHSPMDNLNLASHDSEFKTIRIKITDIDQIKKNDDGNVADNEDVDEEGLILIDYHDARIKACHKRQFEYIEPSVPDTLDNEKLGWILHRLRETPIGPLDRDGDNKINLNEFVQYFLDSVNIKDDDIDRRVYAYAFELMDINGDGDITPLEYYRFFDKYRLFPDDHFVNGTVEYKVLCIKSYGLGAAPVNSSIFADDTTVYFHRTQFQYLIPWKKLDERDDTSDEDDDNEDSYNPRVSFKSSNKLDLKSAPPLVDDETESLYDDAEAEQSALRALDKDDDDDETDDDIPIPQQPISAPPNMSKLDSFEGDLYDAYIMGGQTPRTPEQLPKQLPNESQSQLEHAHPFQQFADPSYSSTTSIPGAGVSKTTVPKLDENDEKSVAYLMKEYSRSNAQLKLKTIGLKMSQEQFCEAQINLKKEETFITEEKLKIHTLKQILEAELAKLGISRVDLDALNNHKLPPHGALSLTADGHYSVEYEEDTMSLGAPTPHLGHGHFKFRSAISAIHSVATTMSFDESREEQDGQIMVLTDKVDKLQKLLTLHDIAIPEEAKERADQEEEEKEREKAAEALQVKRAQRLAMIKTASINAANISVSDYSFGMQLFFEQYDIDSFDCITFDGFFEALKLLQLDDTPENELRAIFYYADRNENNGLNIDELLYAVCVQFLNSILDRKLRLTFGQCDEDFNGALDTEEMRMALDILQVEMSDEHYNLMFSAAQDAGVRGFEDEFDSATNMLAAASDEEDESDESESEDEELPCCDFRHFKIGLLTTQPFAVGDTDLSLVMSDYDQESPSKYVQSLLSLCWHILVQSFDLMDEDHDGLINSRETANIIEYLGITNKAHGDIQTLKGVYKKVCRERNDGNEDKIDLKIFIRVMLQQYFRGISDQSIRCIFESHCQGLMSMDQFLLSFENIFRKLPSSRGDTNYKHLKYKQGTSALCKLFKSYDKHNTNTLEWDKYSASVRDCIVFNLEDNIRYETLFKHNWTQYKIETVKFSDVNNNENNNNNNNIGNIDCDELLKKEFKKENMQVNDIMRICDEYHWNMEGFTNNKGDRDVFEWWILQQIGNDNSDEIEWNTFKRIIYNIWFYSYFELMMKREFGACIKYRNDDEKEEISANELVQFVENMNFGLNDALIRSQHAMVHLCYSKVDSNHVGHISYNGMIRVLQHVALYSMSEFVFLRSKYISHGIVDDNNDEQYLQKEDFLSISRNNMLIFSDGLHSAQHMLIKICNSSSVCSGLFDKFAATQYRGDVVKKLNFASFCSAYLYRLLMELSCFYIEDLCSVSFGCDSTSAAAAATAAYDDYICVFKTLGFKTEDALFSKSHCDSLALCMFGSKQLSLSQFYVFLMNKAMINNLELQIYGSFVEYSGDDRDYITTAECVQLVKYLKNNQIIHGKMYSLEKYIGDYLQFWNNHYQALVFNKKEVVIRKRRKEDKNENDNDKWYFESFLHCLTFHQFQLNHGRSHLLLKAMNLDRHKMKILKTKEKNIKNERLLLNKEKKLHDLYTRMMNSIKKNKSKLIQCKERILDETNAIKSDLNGVDDLLLTVPNRSSKPRTSAVKLAKTRLSNTRRGSVVVKDIGGTSHYANKISVDLAIENNGLPQDFNPFGGANSDSSTDSLDAAFATFDNDADY